MKEKLNLKTNSNPYGTKKEKVIASIFLAILVVLFIVGTTYALTIFTDGSDINTIKSGKISMHYTESSNVININNALPITDEVGKNQTDYFDFSISSKADTNADDNDGVRIPYDLILEPKTIDSNKDSFLPSDIKVYLTKLNGSREEKVKGPVKLNELTAIDTNFNLYSTQNIHKNNNGMITTKYRLRAWIDYGVDTSTWQEGTKQKQYKFSINVNAKGTTENEPNPPLLTSNMIPVYYDESDDNWKKADSTNPDNSYKWYDYDSKMWANAVTVSNTNRATYLSAEVGTPIPMNDINAMFVWIPRYKYTSIGKKCSDLTNPTEESNPECYGYEYKESYRDTLLPILSNLLEGEETSKEEANVIAASALEIWAESEKFQGISFTDFVNLANENGINLGLDLTYQFLENTTIVSGPEPIHVTFEKGVAKTGTISCTDVIAANSFKSETCTDTTNGSIIKGKSTYTHPAFTFGDEELTGIWVGKFENSATVLPTDTSTELRTVIIKPDVESWTLTPLSYFANSIRNMELTNNIYGFSQNGTTLNTYTGEISGDSNNLDTHMMKNMEWGVVTYLSHSKYGKNSEVFINNSSWTYTGRSGGNVGGSTRINGTYPDQTSTSSISRYGFYTYDGYLLNYDTNTKSTIRDLSKVASTTGNIYGIYDMSGGSYEIVMANMQDSSNAFYPNNSGTWSTTNKPLDKYYDKYSFGETWSEYTRGKLGDATIEMGPSNGNTWYENWAYFSHSGPDQYWLTRGGYYDNDDSGLFYFNRIDGNFGQDASRTVLSISPQ